MVMLAAMLAETAPGQAYARDPYAALPDSTLIGLGKEWLSNRAAHTRSLKAFSVVVNRHYRPADGSKPEMSHVVEAMYRIGDLYLVSFYRYDQAYRYLSLARQLAEEYGLRRCLPYIDISLSNLWEVNTMIFPESSRNGFAHMAEAWEAATSSGDEGLLPSIATDMAIMSYSRMDSTAFCSQLSHFLSLPTEGKPWDHGFARAFAAGVRAWLAGDHGSAESRLLEARDMAHGASGGERHLLSALSALVTFYIDRGRSDRAGSTLREYSRLVKHNPDFAMDLYNLYADHFRHVGIPDSADKYHYLYLKEKEAVANERKLTHAGEREFIDSIERVNEEARFLSEKNRRQRQHIAAVSAAAVCLLLAIGMTLRAYRRLRSNSEHLFRKNVEMIEEQMRFSAKQKELQEEVERLRASASASRRAQRPAISDVEAEALYTRLTGIMERGGDVFNPDFSLKRLAQLADSTPRTVSSVINLKYGANFPQFLNEYRIREACIRLRDTAGYGNYTVEAISESVGYRSRTGFSSLFKKATGLSPSEYQRLARRSNTR